MSATRSRPSSCSTRCSSRTRDHRSRRTRGRHRSRGPGPRPVMPTTGAAGPEATLVTRQLVGVLLEVGLQLLRLVRGEPVVGDRSVDLRDHRRLPGCSERGVELRLRRTQLTRDTRRGGQRDRQGGAGGDVVLQVGGLILVEVAGLHGLVDAGVRIRQDRRMQLRGRHAQVLRGVRQQRRRRLLAAETAACQRRRDTDGQGGRDGQCGEPDQCSLALHRRLLSFVPAEEHRTTLAERTLRIVRDRVRTARGTARRHRRRPRRSRHRRGGRPPA